MSTVPNPDAVGLRLRLEMARCPNPRLRAGAVRGLRELAPLCLEALAVVALSVTDEADEVQVEASREPWAYCLIAAVNDSPVLRAALPDDLAARLEAGR